MRCLALVDGLRPHATDVHFICRQLPGEMHALIEAKGFRCSLLPVDESDSNTRLDQDHDAELTASLSGTADWTIVDHYDIDQSWEGLMRPHCRRLMVIDDLVDRAHDCDVLLDQSFGRKLEEYGQLVGADCNVLAGTDYALLRPEFAATRVATLARREKDTEIRHVLVSMGGFDPDDKALEVLEALAGTPYAADLTVTVVTGSGSTGSDASLNIFADRFGKLDIKSGVSNMAELMAVADIAVGAAGTSSWERCCLGLPALIYIYADNQREIAGSLEDAGAIRVWRSGEELVCHLDEYMNDISLLQSAIAAAESICDGLGVQRVVAVMQPC
jgi:UDP-2,4-diacetamido-2,4,6-trideoxy-beta-L-altropyranose hydrolase